MVGSGSWPWIKSAIFIFLRLSTPGERDEENQGKKDIDLGRSCIWDTIWEVIWNLCHLYQLRNNGGKW